MKEVYTLEDLYDRALLDHDAEKPARLAVIGHPITQSRSPQMQQSVLDEEGKNIRYIRLDIEPDKIPEALNQLIDLGFIGCNITIPHKQQAFDLFPPTEELSRRIGAINTLRFPEIILLNENSRPSSEGIPFPSSISSLNTDAPGFISSYETAFGESLEGKKIALIGAGGGAGTAIAYACCKNHCQRLGLINRTVSKIEPLLLELSQAYSSEISSHNTEFTDGLESLIKNSDIIINASSLGLKESDPLPLPIEWLNPHHTVVDIITHDTPLLKAARAKGLRCIDGLPMLIHQGALAYQFWFGTFPNVDTMTQALRPRDH